MDKENPKYHISEETIPTDFDLEEILAEYQDAPAELTPTESLSDRSMKIVLETLESDLDSAERETLGSIIESTVAAGEAPRRTRKKRRAPAVTEAPAAAEAEAEEEPLALRELTDAAPEEPCLYADAAAAETPEPDETDAAEPAEAERAQTKGTRGNFLAPILGLLALIALRRGERRRGDAEAAAEPPEAECAQPEMEPEKAAKFYGAQMGSLRLRGRIAAGLSLVMVYLSFAYQSPLLPITGVLGQSMRVISLLLLILELSVMMTGLDLFTGGLLGIFRGSMGAETLVAVSCVFTALDAIVLAIADDAAYGLPLCAVSAVSMTFAIWGAYATCRGLRTGFRVLKSKSALYTVSGEKGITPDSIALLKSRRAAEGFVRRSEEADAGEYAYGVLTPFLLVAALVLGLLASVAHGQAKAAVHCVSVLLAASASFSCCLCFALPFAAAASRLYQSGAAIAGWSGVRDIGSSRQVVITDADIFPKGTVEIGNIRVLEGSFTDKVISYTASMIAASGNGLSAAFAELVRRNGYSISRVEHFEPHDGGGMTAMVNGENVFVGNAGFMNLMGIRVPQKLNTHGSLYTAINGALVGIFAVEYKPVGSVQDALVLLLHSNLEPIFAIRDFNITPQLIKTKFKMPTDSFKFPPYAERFRISGAEPDRASRVAAVLVREGMGPLVDVAERGRRLYQGTRAATIVSAAGSIFGLIMMFLLCWAGAFDSATASNVLVFMLLWLLPEAVIIFGLQR